MPSETLLVALESAGTYLRGLLKENTKRFKQKDAASQTQLEEEKDNGKIEIGNYLL